MDLESNFYRYNKFIVTTLQSVRGDLRKARRDRRFRDLAQRRLDRLPADIDEQEVRIYQSPIFTDPYHMCSNPRASIVPNEYALRRDKTEFRAIGDVCSDRPTVLFVQRGSSNDYLRRGAGGGTYSVRDVYVPSGVTYADIEGARKLGLMRILRINDVERDLLNFLAIANLQCGSVPASVRIEFMLWYREDPLKSRQPSSRKIYSGTLRTADFTIEHDDPVEARRVFEADQEASRQASFAAAQRARGPEFAAYGFALLVTMMMMYDGPAVTTVYTFRQLPGGRTKIVPYQTVQPR